MTNPVIPAEAVEAHVTDGGSCWCGPTVEFISDGHIVVHNKETE